MTDVGDVSVEHESATTHGQVTQHGPAFGAALRKQALLNADPDTYTITDFAVCDDDEDTSDKSKHDADWNATELAVLKARMKRRDERKRLQWERPVGRKLGVALEMMEKAKGFADAPTRAELRCAAKATWTLGPSFYGTMDFPEKQFNILRAESASFTPSFLRHWVLPFVQREQTIPLRLLQWLVVNYVKDNAVTYVWQPKDPDGNPVGKPRDVSVAAGYNANMDKYHRRHFDAFRRRDRIYFEMDGKPYGTTVAQLLFLRWAWLDGVVDFTKRHVKEIETHMFVHSVAKKKEKAANEAAGRKHRRSECVKRKRTSIAFLRSETGGDAEYDSD